MCKKMKMDRSCPASGSEQRGSDLGERIWVAVDKEDFFHCVYTNMTVDILSEEKGLYKK